MPTKWMLQAGHREGGKRLFLPGHRCGWCAKAGGMFEPHHARDGVSMIHPDCHDELHGRARSRARAGGKGHLVVNVPERARESFFDPPADGRETGAWRLSRRPACRGGDEMSFMFGQDRVARAVVFKVEPPARTRESKNFGVWRVFWRLDAFEDLRLRAGEGGGESPPAKKGRRLPRRR